MSYSNLWHIKDIPSHNDFNRVSMVYHFSLQIITSPVLEVHALPLRPSSL